MAKKTAAPKKETLFKPGQSGNPKGRPPGIRDRRHAARDALAGDLPEVLRVLVDAAKGGDVQAATLILSRVLPPLRPERQPVTLENIPKQGTAGELAQAIIANAAHGQIAPDVASELIGALANVGRILEVDELARRIAALEAEL